MEIIKSEKIKKNLVLNSKHNVPKTGFSLIEIITTLAIFSIIITASVATFNETKNRTVLQDAQATVIHALEQARSRATNGVGNSKHGVHIEEKKVVSFEGDQYIAGNGDEKILPFAVSTNQSDLTIIFNRLSAQPDTGATIILNHISGITETITITPEGIILPE